MVIEALTVNDPRPLTAAMTQTLKSKVRDIFYLVNMAALTTLDLSDEPPDGSSFPSRDLH
jgi:hypothetical protein